MAHKPLKVMLLIETSRVFGRNLLRGIARYIRTHGPWETYRIPPAYRDPYGKDTALAMIHDWGADGLILRETQGFADKIPDGIPTVISSESEEYIPGCGHIVGDHEGIGRMAAEHLIGLGFKNSEIAFQLGFTNHQQIARYFLRDKGITPSAFRKQIRNKTE